MSDKERARELLAAEMGLSPAYVHPSRNISTWVALRAIEAALRQPAAGGGEGADKLLALLDHVALNPECRDEYLSATDEAIEALRAALAPALPEVGEELAWLIERGETLFYWSVKGWQADVNEALRFARRDDAQAFADTYMDAIEPKRISEHAWS